MRLRILGCGTSSGVPRVGNDWGACDSANPRNRRRRASIVVESDTTRILIDTGPDMREQLLDANIDHVDAVIWTHDHADHCHGLDDLRQLFHRSGEPIQGYARATTAEVITQRFGYVFAGRAGYPATVRMSILPDELRIGDIDLRVVDQPHGRITSAGLRFAQDTTSIGYATDFSVLTDEMANLYQQLDVWIVDALRRVPHPTHPTLDQALAWIDQLAPRRALLTHMDQSMDYADLCAVLPASVEPAYDGLEIEV